MTAYSRLRLSVLHIALEALHASLFRLVPVHVWFGIPQLLELFFTEAMVWIEYSLSLDIFELRYPFADVITIRIVPFCLRYGIEHCVAWPSLATCARGAVEGHTWLPPLCIIAEVPVDKGLSEVTLASSIVYEQVAVQIARDVHS
jgi:hypothetical protein